MKLYKITMIGELVMHVNAETLRKRIKSLQARGSAEYSLPLTLNEEYQLEAYKMLLDYMEQYVELQNRYDLDVNWGGV